MPRIRHIKPDFFASDDVGGLSFRARLTWIGLWTQCDDHGRAKDNARIIKGAVWSLNDDVVLTDVEADLTELAARGRIVRYIVDGQRFLAVVNWHRHQRPNRPTRSKIPAPTVPVGVPKPDEDGHCPDCWTHEKLTESSMNGHGFLTETEIPTVQVSTNSDESVSHHAPFIEDSRREGEGEGGMERGGGTRETTNPNTPPNRPRCQRHAHLPADDPGPNCIACRDARLAAKQQPEDDYLADRLAIRACGLCDADGWRVTPGTRIPTTPFERCDHTRNEVHA